MRRILATATLSLSILACTPSAAANATPATTTPTATCDRACWEAIVARQRAERAWWAEVVRQQQARAAWNRLLAHLAATRYPTGQCGGTLPPCRVMHRESGGDTRIWNGPRHGCYAPTGWTGRTSPCGGSTASGKWQILRGTWGRHGGYLNAADAPERTQDDRARQLWAAGRGCTHWNAC